MKKIFTIVDEARGLMRVTTDDERFYIREGKDEVTGLPCHIYRPSVTWIANYVPKGIGFYKWLAEHGWDESEAIKSERGKYGTRVHKAIEMLLQGDEVRMDTSIVDPETLESKSLTFEEYTAVLSFKDWWVEFNQEHKEVEVMEVEHTLWPEHDNFAGSIDLLLKVDGEYWIIDFKTSQNIWLSHEAQLSAYKKALNLEGVVHIAILQVGYKKNKKGFKFTEVEDKYHIFLSAMTFWADEHNGTKPLQKDLPLAISLAVPQEKEIKKISKKHESITRTNAKSEHKAEVETGS